MVTGWHVAFWAMLALGLLQVAVTTGLGGTDRVLLAVLLGTLGLAYLVTVQTTAEIVPWRWVGYLVVAVVVTGLACWIDSFMSLMLFIVYPQTWMFVPERRFGVLFTTLLCVTSTVGMMAGEGWGTAALRSIGPQMVLGLLFSVLLGLWVFRVAEQSAERAQLIAELERTRSSLAEVHHVQGVMAERERLAREIHDTLAQGFTSVVMLAQAASAGLDVAAGRGDCAGQPGCRTELDRLRERLDTIEDVARENLAEARALVAASAPVGLEGTTVQDAVGRLVERFATETGLRVEVHLDGECTGLTRDREVVLLRTAQEALSNVRRHAGAEHVAVHLVAGPDGVRVEIGDDGIGFDPNRTGNGFGLSGMRGRVDDVGGELDVASAPGHGTVVTVRVPREQAPEVAEPVHPDRSNECPRRGATP
jgi:signal transduction histidine kinase